MAELNLDIQDLNSNLQDLVGVHNQNFNSLEKEYNIAIDLKDNKLVLSGKDDDISKAKKAINLMDELISKNKSITAVDMKHLIQSVNTEKEKQFTAMLDETLTRTYSGKAIKARTIGQKRLIDAFKSHDLCFAIGPAGTGKTFLAVAYAVDLLKKNEISKIILTRPAVEAGENLGFLPGDLKEKVDPYLRPLYDALDDLLSNERTERYIEKGIIEIAPLAYMRGRTLDNAVVILDEAQNTTKSQMMMFLSRLGQNSKMIVNGDIQQIDLPPKQESGLIIAERYLKDIEEISFVKLSTSDIVRHPLVSKILEGFEKGAIEDAKNSNH